MSVYRTVVAADSPTHQWTFDSTVNDVIGSANINLVTGYTLGTPHTGLRTRALVSDGNASKFGPYVTGLASVFGSEYSLEMWFKYIDVATAQELARVNDELALEMNTNGTILYYYKGTSANTTPAYDDNAWHHLVITRDASRNVIVYVDKVSRITFTAPTGAPATGNFYLMGDQYTANGVPLGAMDEVALYSTALSSTRVAAHYDAGIAEDDTGTASFRGWGVPT